MSQSPSPQVESKPDLARLTRSVALTSLVVVCLSYTLNAMDRQVFPVLLPQVSADLGYTLAQGGLLATIFTLGIGLAGVPTGFLLDRLSRKSVMLIGIGIYSVFTVLTAFGVGFFDMFAYRALSGVGEAMQNAALFSAVGAYFFANRALAIGSLNFAFGLGGFLGPVVGANLAANLGDWRIPFYIFGAVGFAFVLIIAFFVKRRFTEQVELADEASDEVGHTDHVPARFLNRNVILLGLTAVVVGIAMYGFIGLYPTFLQDELQISLSDAGTIASMFGLGAMMGLPAGYLMDRLNIRNVLIGALLIGAVVGFLIFNGPTSVGWQYVLAFAEGAVASGFCFVGVYAGLQRAVRPALIGRASGFFVSCFYVPASIAGYIFSSLVDGVGWGGAGIWQLTVLPLVGVLVLLFVKSDQFSRVRTAKPH
ncbi:MFS transporter [Ruania zhangjianzhongii]|uniref:MFS transporter n=1 Tax=Ruania zhangjianzhongii TaxID=2603206 RepID=UPI0011CA5086|nr:MFS transporter [Ruania zhangjianzhongii]